MIYNGVNFQIELIYYEQLWFHCVQVQSNLIFVLNLKHPILCGYSEKTITNYFAAAVILQLLPPKIFYIDVRSFDF